MTRLSFLGKGTVKINPGGPGGPVFECKTDGEQWPDWMKDKPMTIPMKDDGTPDWDELEYEVHCAEADANKDKAIQLLKDLYTQGRTSMQEEAVKVAKTVMVDASKSNAPQTALTAGEIAQAIKELKP